jgi:Rrf2 family protein
MFTAREEYGIRAALDLAAHYAAGPSQTRDISHRQGIPEAYLNQILVALRRAGIVNSLRGALGGYVLAAPPGRITAGDVVRALRGEVLTVPSSADVEPRTAVGEMWAAIRHAVEAVLDSTTLEQLLLRQHELDLGLSYMANI